MGHKQGRVYLIGAGPGDPGLLTLRGREILRKADVVVYDFLADRSLLQWCPDQTERLYVGKQAGSHALSQERINALLIEKAEAGLTVARLKGGDPFIFGRGGEEAEALAEHGIRFEVVPGVTSAVAVPAYAGIPLTDRRYASSVAIITGHEDPTKEASRLRWDRISRGSDTLVFLMGVKNLERIAGSLLENGREPQTPAAVIRWGTTPRQQTVTGPLSEIAALGRRAGLTPPAVLLVGEVVGLRHKLRWFEDKPLFGKRIVVTRSREQASELANRLSELGAEPLEFPTIRIRPPDDWSMVDAAVQRLEDYHWAIFTSPNAVRFFLGRMQERGRDIRDLKGMRIAAIGPGTARCLEELYLRVDVMPKEYRAEALSAAIPPEEIKGRRFLLPRAIQAREILPQRLRELGGEVDVVGTYQTVLPEAAAAEARQIFTDEPVDAITFTSSSTVKNFVDLTGGVEARRILQGVAVACIGPITRKTVESLGIVPDIMADDYTIPGLVEALDRYFRNRKRASRSSPGKGNGR
jgi:uroporphyrinogen III methyltransferase/synthase